MRALIHSLRYVNVKKSAMDRIAKCERDGLCLACLEKLDGRVIRACHERCVKATKRAIERGDFTEDERVRDGKLGESSPGGRPASNPVTIEAKQAAS
jgi:hypothetical protein